MDIKNFSEQIKCWMAQNTRCQTCEDGEQRKKDAGVGEREREKEIHQP